MAHSVRLGLLFALFWSWSAVAQADTRVFALVVTSNRGTSIAQPPLAYADDDGVRYFQLFRAAAQSPDDVRLLTTFDKATRAAYPNLEVLAHPPVRAELTAAIADLAHKIQAARIQGEETAFYFVFAGHGEVLEGRGYLGLEDSAIDGSFIEHELVERIPADTKHILLDSCNSFFVVNPRKPNGRRWATPNDMAFGFSARHPEVGVFLSTNAEEEVYEWSKLESGVFSHEVRSGLRGGADIDRNGKVSYTELAGFVTRANEGVVRESLRPHLFFRGPEGKRDATLFNVSALRGVRLGLDAAQIRIWLSDARGERVLDVHKEPGPLTVVAPSDQGELTLFALRGIDPQAVPHAYVVRPEDATLTPAKVEIAPRGERMFGELFRDPYGLAAHFAFEKEEAERPPDVYGPTGPETDRAKRLLKEIAQASRATRRRWGTFLVVTSLIPFGGLVLELSSNRFHAGLSEELVMGGLGAVLAGIGTRLLLTPSKGEEAEAGLLPYLAADGRVQRAAFLQTAETLSVLDRKMRKSRLIEGGVMLGAGLIAGGFCAFELTVRRDNETGIAFGAIGAGLLTLAGFHAFTLSSEERLIRLYQGDPQLSVQLSASASRYGGGLGLRGRF